jgi:hypothetical protein
MPALVEGHERHPRSSRPRHDETDQEADGPKPPRAAPLAAGAFRGTHRNGRSGRHQPAGCPPTHRRLFGRARHPAGFRVTVRNRCWSALAREEPPIWSASWSPLWLQPPRPNAVFCASVSGRRSSRSAQPHQPHPGGDSARRRLHVVPVPGGGRPVPGGGLSVSGDGRTAPRSNHRARFGPCWPWCLVGHDHLSRRQLSHVGHRAVPLKADVGAEAGVCDVR